jgi:hypothetical protein
LQLNSSDLCVHNVSEFRKRGGLRQTTKGSVVIVAGQTVVSASLYVNAPQIHAKGLVRTEQELGDLNKSSKIVITDIYNILVYSLKFIKGSLLLF